MKTIGISGGSGFIGKHLTEHLATRDYKVIIFTRDPATKAEHDNISFTYWDANLGKCDLNALGKLDVMVHLAGAGLADKRWTEKRKQEIYDSRVKGTHFLMSQLRNHAPKCHTIISASAIGYYGPDRNGAIPFTEDANHYNDFLSQTCVAWEKESQAAQDFSRTVILRFGMVLGRESGAYHEFEGPVKMGLKPILGSGNQVESWIHIDDLCELIVFMMNNDKAKGIYNAVAPMPVTQKQMMDAIAKTMGGVRIPLPVPAGLLKLMIGGVSTEILKSCTVSAAKVLDTGFSFQYDTVDSAVKELVKNKRKVA